ncbi:hypothetical protein L9G15_25995, partial [Shewanella sp. A3A]|nr:hypothetical protein [Shewanella ferrihydritica]
AYTGSGNKGNQIVITKILATTAGTSTKGAKIVGQLNLGTTPTVAAIVITPDADSNLPAGYVYKDQVQAGAYIIQANARGVCL